MTVVPVTERTSQQKSYNRKKLTVHFYFTDYEQIILFKYLNRDYKPFKSLDTTKTLFLYLFSQITETQSHSLYSTPYLN